MSDSNKTLVVSSAEQLWGGATRRSFLKLLGIGGTVVLLPSVFEACDTLSPVTGPVGPGGGAGVSLDLSSDIGILNYAYALEQLEAGFYTAAVAAPVFASFNAEQQEVFLDLRSHEVMHREFLKAALGIKAIGSLALNATTVATSLATVASALHAAESFEDLGVSAYNGAGKYLTSATYLGLAGKIVSVEARHAAAIRDIRDALGVTGTDMPGTRFAGSSVVDAMGLDVKLEPATVLSRVQATTFVTTQITVTNQPTGTPTADEGPPSPTP